MSGDNAGTRRATTPMYDAKSQTILDRIVSLSQYWVRPIIRDKVIAKTKFGSKLHLSVTDGYSRIKRFDLTHAMKRMNERTLLKAITDGPAIIRNAFWRTRFFVTEKTRGIDWKNF